MALCPYIVDWWTHCHPRFLPTFIGVFRVTIFCVPSLYIFILFFFFALIYDVPTNYCPLCDYWHKQFDTYRGAEWLDLLCKHISTKILLKHKVQFYHCDIIRNHIWNVHIHAINVFYPSIILWRQISKTSLIFLKGSYVIKKMLAVAIDVVLHIKVHMNVTT